MKLEATFTPYTLIFNFDARTSRGAMKTKDTWLVRLADADQPGKFGWGECSTLPKLSIDYLPDYEDNLEQFGKMLGQVKKLEDLYKIPDIELYPSILFGLETALHDLLNGGQKMIFPNAFYQSAQPLPINGLVWMGDRAFMEEQVNEKIAQGFTCIKLKIGGIAFDDECAILERVRSQYPAEQITLRVDANGAFTPEEALPKLERLAQYQLHSIEQPLKPNSWSLMAKLAKVSRVPIALDEELIGISEKSEKIKLLDTIKPQYLVLKPSLLGGFKACQEWIELAEKRKIGWWITSALESNIGLNAICQFAEQFHPNLPQGLGTGQLYTNNIPSPLVVENGQIRYDSTLHWGQ